MVLHGFSDASETMYAATVYLRLVSRTGLIQTNLLTARTKIAPVKIQSVPRLKLYGALLLARLLDQVARGLQLDARCIFAWTDSRLVLNWIRSHASRWTSFVINRVAKI